MRCNRCRTRNTFKKCPVDYRPPRGLKQTQKEVNRILREIGGKRCRSCGHTAFYLDKERTNRKPCHCRARRAEPAANDEDLVIELSLAGVGGRSFPADVVPF
jgi:hypothetical protein